MITLPIAVGMFVATIATDAAIGAAVAGIFSIVNTVLTAQLIRGQREVQRTIRAPRSIVYDAQGNPVGTILELRGELRDTEPLP